VKIPRPSVKTKHGDTTSNSEYNIIIACQLSLRGRKVGGSNTVGSSKRL